MDHVIDRIEAMSPEQRRALCALLDKRGADFNVFPLSFAQQRLWFLEVLHGQTPLYTVPYSFWLTGRLDLDAFAGALATLVARHESLRTVFFDVEGVPYQRVVRQPPFRLGVRRWRPQDAERNDLVARLLDAEARRTFDLRRGPLVSANVLTTGGDRHLFLLTLHHIICDGWSMGILFRELELLYTDALHGRQPHLPPLPLRYGDFARWQSTALSAESTGRDIAYWRHLLSDAPPPPVLGMADPDSSAGVVGAMRAAQSPPSLARAVEAACRQYAVTPFMLLLAVFAVILRRRTGSDDVIIGTPVANRTRLELEDVVGFFVNTLPLRIRLAGRHSLRELLAHVRDVTLGAQAHQELPFEMIVQAAGASGRTEGNPLFQVSFIVQEQETETLRLPGLDVSITHGHGGTAKFDLTVSLVLLETGLKCMVEYRTAVVDDEWVDGLIEEMRRLTEAAIGAPDEPLETLLDRATP